jgi:RNA polymerase sigma-70 factor (ECF subfamily)
LREVIVLRELQEFGYRQIAEVTGVPIGTVMSRLYRARSLLLRTHNAGDAALPDQTLDPEHGSAASKSSGGQRCVA